MLAYVFWHRATGPEADYEEALRAFHGALGAAPPAGFRCSLAARLDAAPWLPGEGTAYEDWYLVEDWAALGTLNVAAVSGARRGPHDVVAGRAGSGSGGVYAPFVAPEAGPEGATGTWLAKPAGTGYGAWRERLSAAASGTAAVWQRQLTLGPAPEFTLLGDTAPPDLPGAVTLARARVA